MRTEMSPRTKRSDPFSPFFTFNRLWDDWLQRSGEESRMIVPAMDVAETPQGYTITAELPGLQKDDVKITFEDGVVSISGEKKVASEATAKDYHRIERRYGSFHRTLTLPTGIDTTKATAAFADGLLTVELPKSEAAKPRTLEID